MNITPLTTLHIGEVIPVWVMRLEDDLFDFGIDYLAWVRYGGREPLARDYDVHPDDAAVVMSQLKGETCN